VEERAVQLVGPDELRLNEGKQVVAPGEHQVLARVEACGLCFSDLKLLKQFDRHARKSAVTSGIAAQALEEMPNYAPGDSPTVPGHEAVIRVVGVGAGVTRYEPGERFLVQTDYRWLPTAGSNAAFGYNFEGGLQEYVLLDERVIVSPDGESMLIPAPEDLSAAAIALCEPWACVERAYVEEQRRLPKAGGRMLVVGEEPVERSRIAHLRAQSSGIAFTTAAALVEVEDNAFDDVVYFGANPASVERLFPKLAAGGLFVIVQCGARFGRPVLSQVGRVHYGGIRVAGTTGDDPADALASIPATPELRPGETIDILGAAGPMGTMHVIRCLCQGVPGITVLAGDLNDERLAVLAQIAEPLARENDVGLRLYNSSREQVPSFTYAVLMAPVAELAAEAVLKAAPGAIVNIFAGIPAETTAAIDLDAYIEKRCYFVGTSGSTLEDMKSVLAKVVAHRLDTALSVAAVSGLDGAIDGIRAIERNLLPGKILVYPACKGLGLTPIAELADGHWSKPAEDALLARFAAS
jgi:L-sorbose 1-phosphate reductase